MDTDETGAVASDTTHTQNFDLLVVSVSRFCVGVGSSQVETWDGFDGWTRRQTDESRNLVLCYIPIMVLRHLRIRTCGPDICGRHYFFSNN